MKNIISRWWHSHGFGIESKTDFAFLHDIIREDLPYYAYEEWKERFPEASKQDTMRARLMLRLCNYIQPNNARIYGDIPPVMQQAITAGYRKTVIETCGRNYTRLDSVSLNATLCGGLLMEFLPLRTNATDSCTAIVLTDIDNANASLWQDIVHANTITYDMRDMGIALIRPNRYPEHYTI